MGQVKAHPRSPLSTRGRLLKVGFAVLLALATAVLDELDDGL